MIYYDSTGKVVHKPMSIRQVTSAIIFDDSKKILLEKRSDNGHWGLPGGAVDIGESVEDAVIREVLEETGLKVRRIRLVGIYSDPKNYTIASYPDGNVVQGVVICFECEKESGDLQMSSESTDIGYFETDSLPDDTLEGHKRRIMDALESNSEPFIR